MSGFSNLFGAAQLAGPKPALSFRAGKMHKSGTTVRADTRKGMVQIIGDQGFIHFQWKDRMTGSVEDELMIFAEEAKYFRVEKCTTGRVYCLQFQQGQGSREFFFWMQEPSTDKDDHYCALINSFIKDPRKCRPDSGNDMSMLDAADTMGYDMRDTGSSAGTQSFSATGGSVPGGASGGANIDLDTLQAILGGMRVGGAQGAQGAQGAAAAPAQQQQADVQLTDLFAQEAVRQILSGDQDKFEERLGEHFPEGIETSILEEIRSPQFRQTLDILQAALSDPQAREELTTAFGLPASTELTRGGVDQFIRSILAWQAKQEKK
eukprot:TRINITY_DN15808_c0_g4_i1.p1 TRINITY_DN15808_c0_g4~~TRINITY_DN15808_c0_g4_i1.p1  ORF type:complete len:334 (+),score=115.10 TRINITY_DN15808_c0_g4_i1:41-1003(+)